VIKKIITDQALTHSALTRPVQSFILNHLSVRQVKKAQKRTKAHKRIKKKKEKTKG